MPIRIYTLAKDLGIENKQLVDICTKLGIHGKGSALASLTDEETEKVKSHLAAPSKPAAPAPVRPASGPLRPAPGPIRTLPPASRPARSGASGVSAPPESPAAPEAEAPLAAPAAPPPAPKPAPPVSPPVPAPVVERAAEPKSPPAPAMPPVVERPSAVPPAPLVPTTRPSRDDFGMRARGPLRDLTNRPKRGAGEESSAPGTMRRDAPRRDPVVRMAAMPDVKQPPAPKRVEEKVQKPDIALPQDAIRKAKAGGGMAPLQQFTESSKAKQDSKRKDTKGRLPGEPVVVEEAAPGRGGKRKVTPVAKEGETEAGLANARDARTAKRARKRTVGGEEVEEGGRSVSPRRFHRRGRGPSVSTSAPRKEAAVVQVPCSVRELSEAGGIGAGQVLRALMEMGQMANINAQLQEETARFLVEHLGLKVEFRQPQTLEEEMLAAFEEENASQVEPTSRPPIVTFLGHVDHGKTSLLDRIIGINVVSGEAGGITQHIRAYSVEKDGRRISFVDTPGHEAFTEMRARGANVTDIAVLVVAADDGIMPQTEEAISHARAAEVPIVVALNKCDLPGVNFDRVLQDLAAHNLLPSEWGGDVEVVRTSALTGQGIDELLETLLATAELYELTAEADGAATGVCLEAEQESDRGVIAKIMVQRGKLKVGDVVVCGDTYGRVKAMYDTLDRHCRLEEAGPSTPVNLTGLDKAPAAGDRFYVLDDIAKAREIAETRGQRSRERSLSGVTTKVSLEEFQQRLESGTLGRTEEKVTLNLIIRADTRGSIEAIQKELGKLEHPEIEIRILQASVGGVSVADVTLAQASQAVIIAFNVVPDENARSLADERQVEIRRYDIIYKVADDIKATLEGRLKPTTTTVDTGTAMVLRTFTVSRIGTIAGCRVMRGSIERDCRIRVIRENRIIGEYAIESLRREKDDVKEVRQGMECGIKLQNFNDVKEADTLEAFRFEQVARTL